MRQYLQVLSNRNFALLWAGSTISQIGDSLSWVALVWFIYQLTDSTIALGIFLFCFTAPTIIGGLIAGVLLDRFDRRKLMMWDNLIRASAIAGIPILHHLGLLELWHMYLAAAIFGSLMMLSLAGGPAIVPALLRKEQLNTANAMESVSWTLGDILGRIMAGFLIGWISAPNVLLLDVLSYLLFVICLWSMRIPAPTETDKAPTVTTANATHSLKEGFQFILSNRVIFSMTVVFLLTNVGLGSFGVLLPVFTDSVLKAGSEGFGLLTASSSLGQLTSSLLVGGMAWKFSLGRSLAVTIILIGLTLFPLLFSSDLLLCSVILFLNGCFTAPINIWAQTIRMQLIPEALRGRVFSILRTVIRSTLPLSTAAFGFIVIGVGVYYSILLVAALTSFLGLIALLARAFEESKETKAAPAVSES